MQPTLVKCCGFLKGTAPGTQQFYKALIYSFQPPDRGKLRSMTQHNPRKKVTWKEFYHLPFSSFCFSPSSPEMWERQGWGSTSKPHGHPRGETRSHSKARESLHLSVNGATQRGLAQANGAALGSSQLTLLNLNGQESVHLSEETLF